MENKTEGQVTKRKFKTLSVAEALSILPEGETIHVYTNPAMSVLIGADWDRQEIIDLISGNTEKHIGGINCRNMGHGLVVRTQTDDGDEYFIQTIDQIPSELF